MTRNEHGVGVMLAAWSLAIVGVGAELRARQATPPASTPPVSATPAPAVRSDAPASPAAPADAPEKADPSLDELLGLRSSAPKPTADGAALPARRAIDEQLRSAKPEDALNEAVKLMGDAAARLQDPGDVSLATQRVQQEILDKLDQVIAAARKQRQQQSKQQQKPKPDDQQQSQQQQQQQQQQAQQEQQAREQRARGEGERKELPGAQAARLNPGLDGARAGWGTLPARVRDALLQGSGEKFSSVYQQMTEDYYRRLAQEKK